MANSSIAPLQPLARVEFGIPPRRNSPSRTLRLSQFDLPMTPKTLLAGLALFAGLSSPSFAQFAREDTPSSFTAIEGQREFSGWMIARPLQVVDATATGLSAERGESLYQAAHQFMRMFEVREYVAETDEYIFAVPQGWTENQVSDQLMGTRSFQYVEPDWILYPIGAPNDSLFSSQWQHQANIMQSADGWDLHTGNPSTVVAFCDTGIRTSHEDFQSHRREAYNAVDRVWENSGGNIGAVHPHGTMVTGCGAANGNNNVGVAGVGWDLGHRMMRVSNSSGGGASLSDLQHAARTAIEAGDKVASVSYSGVDSSSNLTTATYVKSIGGLLVWAAGNDNRNLTFGNRDNDDIIVAGASTSSDTRASFSAYGQFVDVIAPGQSVLTTDSGSDSDYAYVSGTSFACPMTAGLCGLIWSYDPSLTPDEVEDILKQGVDDLGAAGVDNTYGYGRINIFGSLSLVNGGNPTPPTADFSATPLTGTAPLLVAFSDNSTDGPTNWSWSFGDGNASSAQNPSHTYTAAGTYSVTLTVSNADGSDSLTRTDYIVVNDPGGGNYTGQGFILSKNADFSTDDRSFSRSDTVYILVWTDVVDRTDIKRSWFQFKKKGLKARENLTNNGDNSYTASFDFDDLPSNETSWNFKAMIKDRANVRYAPTAKVTVN